MANKRTRTVNIDFLREPDQEGTLSDLFAGAVAESYPVSQISPQRLQDNPYQPRLRLDPAGVEDLAAVIKSHGFQGVLVARPHPKLPDVYQLAFGHRRREAAKLAGLDVLPVIIRSFGEDEMVELAIAENIQRQDLTALEEGRTFDMMVKVLGYTYEQIAAAIGKTRGYVENRLRVAWAPQDVQDLVEAKPDSLRAVSTLIKLEDSALRAEIIKQLLIGQLTADDLPGYIEASREGGVGRVSELRENGAAFGSSDPDQHAGTAGEFDLSGASTQQPGDMADVERQTGGAGTGSQRTDRRAQPGASPDASQAETDERTRTRTGYAQIATALRAATKFQSSAAGRDEISAKEFIALADLRGLVDELYTRYSPRDVRSA